MEENQQVEMTDEQLEVEKQKIRDNINNPQGDTDEDVELPSEKNEEKVYANVFKSVDELKKGVVNIGSDLPDYVLDGMSEDALEKYYLDLRRARDSKPKEEEVQETEEPTKDAENKPVNVPQDLWNEIDKQYNENGDITEEQSKKLEDLGIPKHVQEQYKKGLEADKQNFTNKLYDMAGGQDNFEIMKSWAEENYSQEQLDKYTSGSYEEVLENMELLKFRYLEANGGKVQRRVMGDNVSSATNAYKSQEEYLVDRMSSEYRKNPRFKAKVDAKFKSSSFAS